MYQIITHKNNEEVFEEKLNFFLQENQNSLKSFRYFNKRNFDVLKNHIYTSLYFYENEFLGYGHLDSEDGKVWLGIIVSEKKRNMGIGKFIMDDLLKQYSGEIFLTVDLDNQNAIKLYKNKNFSIIEKRDKYYLMKR